MTGLRRRCESGDLFTLPLGQVWGRSPLSQLLLACDSFDWNSRDQTLTFDHHPTLVLGGTVAAREPARFSMRDLLMHQPSLPFLIAETTGLVLYAALIGLHCFL